MGAGTDLVVQIYGRIDSAWVSQHPECLIERPNGALVGNSVDIYGRLSFLSDGEPVTVAAGEEYPERHFDTIQCEFLAAIGTGRLAIDKADAWAALWKGHPIAGFRFGVTQRIVVGRVTDPNASRFKVDALTRVERDYST